MRIKKEFLLKAARDIVTQRTRSEPDLHAAFLMGSILEDEPLLGGTTDIDIMFVHKYFAPFERETLPLIPELSLDIYHKTLDDYGQLRDLRKDAWMGYPVTNTQIILLDTDHWLEYVQSSVGAEFHRSDNVQARVHTLLSAARNGWLKLIQDEANNPLQWLDTFLNALALGAHAISGLIGPPLPTRRFSVKLKEQTENLGVPAVWTGFCGLLGCLAMGEFDEEPWLSAFEEDFNHITETTSPPVHLSACRQAYYFRGLRALSNSDDSITTVWPLLRTWLDIQLALPAPSPRFEDWSHFIESLNLTEAFHDNKVEALDSYLDSLEILIESWAETYGA